MEQKVDSPSPNPFQKDFRVKVSPGRKPKPVGAGKNWAKGQGNSAKGRRKSKANRRQAARLAERDGGWFCHWCKCPLSYDEPVQQNQRRHYGEILAQYPTVDHIIEWAISHDNSDSNCVLACQPCNNQRSKEFDLAMNAKHNPPSTKRSRRPPEPHLTFRLEIPEFPVAKQSETS